MDVVGREGGEQCRWQENAGGVDGTVKNNQICFMTIRRRGRIRPFDPAMMGMDVVAEGPVSCVIL